MVIIQRMVKKNKKNIFQKEQREASRTSARLLQKYLGIKKKTRKENMEQTDILICLKKIKKANGICKNLSKCKKNSIIK